MLTRLCAQLFGLRCVLLSMSECSLWDDSPDEVRNAKAFERSVNATLGNETYFLGEMNATSFGRVSFYWGTAAAFAFNKYYIGPGENLPNVSARVMKGYRIDIINPLINSFKYSSEFADAMLAPFGKVQCNLLPDVVTEHKLVPLLGPPLDAVAKELAQALANLNNGTFNAWTALRGIRTVCENYIDIDRLLGAASELIGPDCDKANDTDSSADVRNAMETYAQLKGFPPGKSHTTVTAISSIWWPSIALNLARKAVDDVPVTSNVDAKTWEERKAHNNATAANVVCKLHSEFNTTGYSFDALVYLPFTDARMHCLKSDNDSFYEYKRGNTNYFVKRFRSNLVKDQKAANKWKTSGDHTSVLDSVFSTAAANLCTRLEEVEKKFLDGEAFSSIAAVRCGYAFVWYQLAHRYFPAAGTTSKFVMTSHSKNVYNPNCGQIIVFR